MRERRTGTWLIVLFCMICFLYFTKVNMDVVAMKAADMSEVVSFGELDAKGQHDFEEVSTDTGQETSFRPEFGARPKNCLGVFTLTAYCPCEKCCGVWSHNRPTDDMGNEIVIGAFGCRLVPGVSVAVDPEVIPYGTELEIDGAKYIAHDCGGSIKGNRIDVYFADHQEALIFGVKTNTVYLVGVNGV